VRIIRISIQPSDSFTRADDDKLDLNHGETMKARLLVVDDEPGMCELLGDSFRLIGYEVVTAADGASALASATQARFNLIISDINMPHMDGLAFIEQLRAAQDQTPIIMLSARNGKEDITTALRLGADDFVAKPFGLEELALRVAAVLRRTMPNTEAHTRLVCGPIVLDEDVHQVFLRGEPVELSPTEFYLLQVLMQSPGKLVTKATLLSKVWNIGFRADSNVVSTYISYLRKKLHTPEWQGIKTVRGLGFQIDPGA
jgi:two-component system OmpR family response regulator